MLKHACYRHLTGLLVAVLLGSTSIQAQTTWYVDDNAPNDPAPGDPTVSDFCDPDPGVSNDAPALFPLGSTDVTWTAVDDDGNTASAMQNVLIEDTTPPEVFCNAPATITPPDAPISFTATAEDVCEGPLTPVITEYGCFKVTKKGKIIDKTESCIVSFAGDTITIADSGGVATRITWTAEATDGSGNITSLGCAVDVVRP